MQSSSIMNGMEKRGKENRVNGEMGAGVYIFYFFLTSSPSKPLKKCKQTDSSKIQKGALRHFNLFMMNGKKEGRVIFRKIITILT